MSELERLDALIADNALIASRLKEMRKQAEVDALTADAAGLGLSKEAICLLARVRKHRPCVDGGPYELEHWEVCPAAELIKAGLVLTSSCKGYIQLELAARVSAP